MTLLRLPYPLASLFHGILVVTSLLLQTATAISNPLHVDHRSEVNTPKVKLSPRPHGLFFEDINYGSDSGRSEQNSFEIQEAAFQRNHFPLAILILR